LAAFMEHLNRRLEYSGEHFLRLPIGASILPRTHADGKEGPSQGPSRTAGDADSDGEFHVIGDLLASRDFRTLWFRGKVFLLTPMQAAAVRVYWETYDRTGEAILAETRVLQRIGSRGSRLRDVFRGSPAWKLFLVPERPGFFRFTVPD
jgi:hypothetical protein